MDLILSLKDFGSFPLPTHVLLRLLNDYKSPYDKIVEMVKKGWLIQLRKGLYQVSPKITKMTPESFLIANHLYGPSYVSLESALSFWGLIPERVFEITSVTSRLSHQITNQMGRFSFLHLPVNYFSLGLKSIEVADKQNVLIASKEKAICDQIISTSGLNIRSKKQALEYLIEDMRIEEEDLCLLNLSEINDWISLSPKKQSLVFTIQAISELC
jgi:predicted transcriptional regulator of viral defense system